MECPECQKDFDEKRRRPKALACGHTVCLLCLGKTDKCLVDRKPFTAIPSELPDNQSVLALMRSSITTNGHSLQLWCVECSDDAVENCVDMGHKIASKKKLWHEQALKNLPVVEDKLSSEYFTQLIENLEEETAAKALKMLSGEMSTRPLELLVQGGTSRWISSLLPEREAESEDDKIVKGMLLLMALDGVVSKDLILSSPVEESIDVIEEEVDPDTELDLTNISNCRDLESVKSEKETLLSSDRLTKVRQITGLYCDVDRQWCLEILKRLAPYAEEVHIYNFHFEHLDVVRTMPELKWLVLDFIKDSGKTQPEYQLPALQSESKVEFLWVNFPQDENQCLTAEIIKSYSDSVQTVFTTMPSYYGYAVKFLDGMDLPNMKMLGFTTLCTSDATGGCYEVMIKLRKKFPGRKIRCTGCNRTETFDD